MLGRTCVAATAAVLLLAPGASSQSPAPDGTEWSIGSIDVSGLVDGYYGLNLNHPVSRTNQLRNFDVRANQFSLNMAKLTMEHSPAPLGFRFDFGFGRAFDLVHSSEIGPEAFRYVEQAFMSYKPAVARGLQVDFGKFVTSAGAEVIETDGNWNYSRSLLFTLAIPYYHFGLRASMPLGRGFSAGAQLVNGWNNVEDANSGKTVGLTGAWGNSKLTWSHNYYTGTEATGPDAGRRQVYDTILLLTPTSHSAFYVNFDYGTDRDLAAGSRRWTGVAGAARFAVNEWLAVAPRLEWFNDADGFSTGVAQKLKEFTLTTEFKMSQGLLSRLEYRRDWSDARFFDRGSTPATFTNQNTFVVGLVAYFGPKR